MSYAVVTLLPPGSNSLFSKTSQPGKVPYLILRVESAAAQRAVVVLLELLLVSVSHVDSRLQQTQISL